ncbi:hypothetical protein [Paraburkholderia rhizosphaerae]|uniref:Uncharacterized protein n=1 Tax=Paraburkholderia rhizosphaerae TaxID=480658 RepID=A0A4R8KQ41_9BURK|nr:hypothetical protein [Paraburkholderia rhizosphaerae]TDY31280.1 hypothetical protein BX592_1516 [Paraburkholderia rhizosphaerae]
MIQFGQYAISYAVIGFVCVVSLTLIGLVVAMHVRHKYDPNLVGALIGGFLCFLLLEALPALT